MYSGEERFLKPFLKQYDYSVTDRAKTPNLAVMVFFIVMGIFVSMGLSVNAQGNGLFYPYKDSSSVKIEKLKTAVETVESQNSLVESDILTLNHTLNQILEKKEKEQFTKLANLTGYADIVGSGIIINVADSDKPLNTNENPNSGIVHNTDLLRIVNDLWSAKAKAISINDQRITALTEINCIGPAVLVNKTRMVPPFIVKAVGNPDKLVRALKNGHIQSMELYGIKFFIEKYDKIKVAADSSALLGEY
jgi:uncharacterized protein YlxW (UPF0749 family)